MTKFDAVMSVDWSAASTPRRGPDSCWVAYQRMSGRRTLLLENPVTRWETIDVVRQIAAGEVRAGRRCLVLIDLSLGFVAGTAEILGLSEQPAWRAIWAELERRVRDTKDNVNNRIEVADTLNRESGVRLFWGRPVASSFNSYVHVPIRNVSVPGLRDNPLSALRRTEERAGFGVQSNWMLVGRGAVGGQVLTGLAHLERLVRTFAEDIAVWPFCGFRDPGTPLVLAETWHSLFPFDESSATCRDEAQVRGCAEAIRNNRNNLETWMKPPAAVGLSERDQSELTTEEGWTFGVL